MDFEQTILKETFFNSVLSKNYWWRAKRTEAFFQMQWIEWGDCVNEPLC